MILANIMAMAMTILMTIARLKIVIANCRFLVDCHNSFLYHMHKQRCTWCGADPLYVDYHDREWGVPVYDDQVLFEFLILESMQAGLSWITILRKRENFRLAFDHFSAEKIANYSDQKINQLLSNQGIIRHRLKIESAINNARKFLDLKNNFGKFSDYIWQFTDHKIIQHHYKNPQEVLTTTAESNAMSRDLKQNGFKFLGSTICYAYMQAVGMVNDHLTSCFRYLEVNQK